MKNSIKLKERAKNNEKNRLLRWCIEFSFLNLHTEKNPLYLLHKSEVQYYKKASSIKKQYFSMKTIIKILLVASIGLLSYFCVMSILTPIKFDETKTAREKEIIQRLIDIRTAEVEYKTQKGAYTDNFDELIKFLKSSKKKTVLKEGSLSDKQLEAGLTEKMAAKIVRSGNRSEIIAKGLENFRRDTAYLDMIESIFPQKYTAETIDQIAIIPYSNNERFELKVNNEYYNATKIKIPLFEASAHFKTYLYDLNRQELLNIIDVQTKLEKYPGLKVGSIEEPNNNAGNWE
ncbi:MAG: hypothetical protein WBI53_03730 [Paludibacter sp.]